MCLQNWKNGFSVQSSKKKYRLSWVNLVTQGKICLYWLKIREVKQFSCNCLIESMYLGIL